MPGSAPAGWVAPKTDWTSVDGVIDSDINRIEGNTSAIETGDRTIDPGITAPTGNIGTLRQLLDWFAGRIKALLGTTNWYDTPPITLSGAKAHVDAVSAHGDTNEHALSFYLHDVLIVEDKAMTINVPFHLHIEEIRLTVDTAPTGANIILDLMKNGVTIYTTQSNRPTILIGQYSATAVAPDIPDLPAWCKLTLKVAQIGSTVAGSNLAMTIRCTRVVS